MNLTSDYQAGQALALFLQITAILLIGLTASLLLRAKGPGWKTVVIRSTLAVVLAAMISAPFLRPSPHPLVSIAPVATGPKLSWPVPAGTQESVKRPRTRASHTAYSEPRPIAAPNQEEPAPQDLESPVPVPRSMSLRDVGLLVWLLGAAGLLGWIGVGQMWLLAIRSRSVASPAGLVERLEEMARKQGTRAPCLILCPSVQSPFVAGWLRPTIYLPATFRDKFDSDEIEAILAHELVHIRHHDCVWNLVSKLVCALAWPNPAAWVASRQLAVASEELCDQAVIESGLAPKRYAECLLRVAEVAIAGRTQRLVGVGVIEFRSTLGKRIRIVLDGSRRSIVKVPRLVRYGTIAVAGMVAIGACLAISANHPPAAGHQADAQLPRLPPSDPAAEAYLKQCLDAYANLTTFSARVNTGNGDFDRTTIDLAVNRPKHQALITVYRRDRLSPEATILCEPDRFYVMSPDHPHEYVVSDKPPKPDSMPRRAFPWRSDSSLLAALDVCFVQTTLADEALGQGSLLEPRLKSQSVTFGPNGEIDGRPTKTILLQQQVTIARPGRTEVQSETQTLEIDDADHLVRRASNIWNLPHSEPNGPTETFSNVKVSPVASFEIKSGMPPANWKRIELVGFSSQMSPEADRVVEPMRKLLQSANTLSFSEDETRIQEGARAGQKFTQHMRLTAELEKPLKTHLILTLDMYPRQNMDQVCDGTNVYVTQGGNAGKYFETEATPWNASNMGGMGIPVNSCDTGFALVDESLSNSRQERIAGTQVRSATFHGEPVDEVIDVMGGHDRYGFPNANETIRTYMISKSTHLLVGSTEEMRSTFGGEARESNEEDVFKFRVNDPIPAGRFVFDTTGKTAVSQPHEASRPMPPLGLNLQLGDTPPDFTCRDLQGHPLTLSQFRGHAVLLYGWTFGIGNYQWDLPHFEELYEKYKKAGLVVIGIPYDGQSDLPEILKYVREHHIRAPQLFDGEGRQGGIQKLYWRRGTMFNYVIDRHGRLYAKDAWNKDVDKAVEEVISGAAP